MRRLLIFGGTSEGVRLCEALPRLGYAVTVCVATEYGAQMLEGLPVEVRTGRLTAPEMASMMVQGGYDRVIDATHPYAVEVSANLRSAAEEAGLPLERLLRPEGEEAEGAIIVPTPQAAAERLRTLPGGVLLTTGSKDLACYTCLPDYRERIWVRILASEASLHTALSLGYPAKHLIAMHGPFSAELNAAMLRQFEIRTLVTKRSGQAGGFPEKAAAAQETGVTLLVIDRPEQEQGYTLEQLLLRYQERSSQ